MAQIASDKWVLIDPKELLPCSLGVIARESRLGDLERMEREGRERTFRVRAILSDHIPLAGSMTDILERPSYHLMAVNTERLSIYLHHGGNNAVYFDLVGAGEHGMLECIEVVVNTRFPANCFAAARTAVSQLLDSMMRTAWLPLVIRRLDLFAENDDSVLCQELILPFTDGVRWGPLGGIHQYPFFAAYDALIREAITTGSPYYRLLCAYRLYEGIQPLRKTLRDIAGRLDVAIKLPKTPPVDVDWLKRFGIRDEFLAGLKNVDDFWKRTSELRNAAAHFLLDDAKSPMSLSDGATYQQYSLAGALLLHYSHLAFKTVSGSIPDELGNRLTRGSISPDLSRKANFALRPDKGTKTP